MYECVIVIPTYNAGDFIFKNIEIYRQLDKDKYKVVLVDNGTKDPQSLERLEKIKNEYVTYEGRGQAGRWVKLNGRQSSAVVHDVVIVDLAKLWAVRMLTNKHASTMRKAAHKIKVNAFKSIRRVGDKRI